MLSNRKLIFIILTIIGIIFTLYFFISKEWFLAIIGALFSVVAAYNIICKEKK